MDSRRADSCHLRRFVALAILLALAAPKGGGQGAAPEDDRGRRLARAEKLLAEGRAKEAEREVGPLATPGSTDALALNVLGKARHLQKDWKTALGIFRRVCELSPRDAAARLNLGICAFDDQQFETTETTFLGVLELDARAVLAEVYLGRLAMERGEVEAAVLRMDRAIAIDPGSFVAHYYRGVFLAKVGRHAEASESLRNCVGIDPSNGSAHLNLALSLRRLGRDSEAASHFERFRTIEAAENAASRRRQLLAARMFAASDELKSGRLDSALSFAREARDLEPGSAAIHALLSEILSRLGQADEAAREKIEAERLARAGQGR